MRPAEVRIGETYRIRELDDLVAEFGLAGSNVKYPIIATPCIIRMQDAKKICGMPFTPMERKVGYFYNSFRGGHTEIYYASAEGTECDTPLVTVTAEMLEPLDEKPPLEPSVNDLLDLLMT